jgi:hypothetical protein
MVQYENVKATVIRYEDKEPYPEYGTTQKAAGRTQHVETAYIEIVSGERFTVVVELLPAFDFQSSSHVRIRCSVDGMAPKNFHVSERDVEISHSAAAYNRKKTWEQSIRKIDGRWMKCGLEFADLQLGM